MNKISKNPITNKNYRIPDKLDDSVLLNEFIKDHSESSVVVVQGLGFVGAVMSFGGIFNVLLLLSNVLDSGFSLM